MIVDFVGINCIGKSFAIEYLVQKNRYKKVMLENTDYATVKIKPKKIKYYLETIFKPYVIKTILKLIILKQINLVPRFIHFCEWSVYCNSLSKTEVWLREECLIKKMLEMLPWDESTVFEKKRVKALNKIIYEIIKINMKSSNIAFLLILNEEEYLRRFKARNEFNSYSEEQALYRYGLYKEIINLAFTTTSLTDGVYLINLDDQTSSLNEINEKIKSNLR